MLKEMGKLDIVVVDFGIAGVVQGVHADTNKPGSLKYIPPEVVKQHNDVVAPS
jgi:hypothetical protein